MKGRKLKPIVALLLALMLLMPFAAPAEDALPADAEALFGDESLEVMGDEAAEALPEAATEDMIFIEGEAPEATSSLAAEAGEIVSNAFPSQITLGVKEKRTLNASSLARGKSIKYKSSKSKVASVSKKGVVTAKKKGTAWIRCYAGGKLLAKCKVSVVAAPKKVALDKSKLTLGVKETWQLTPSITNGTHASYTWSSKKKSIASVSGSGLVTGKKQGKTTVTVVTQNGKKAKVTVSVLAAPGKVTLNKGTAKLLVNGTVQLKATLPKKTASAITWASSNSRVAKVSASGKVTALRAGKATVTASTFNGRTAECVVTVSAPSTPKPTAKPTPKPTAKPTQKPTVKPTATPKPVSAADSEVKYRALLIGEERFQSETCSRNRGDVSMMYDMLRNVRGLYGGSYSITKKYDLSASQILKAIKTTFADADDNDVSLFFIATHGDVRSTGDAAGALYTCPEGKLKMKELAAALKAVPGKVIVILESCGSGAAVYANGKSKLEQAESAAKVFDRAAVQAFSQADPGIEMETPKNGVNSSGVRSNTGELRLENKFYVLTASRYQEMSWGMEDNYGDAHFNFFTMWLTDGIGLAGHMPADTDYNGQTTLKELYSYISGEGDRFANSNGGLYYQHVQVYPSNSGYVLFTR